MANWSLAQDTHFSMANLSPLTLNPANTGYMDGDWRFSSNYRTQWKAISVPMETYSAAYEWQNYSLPIPLSAGLVFVSDQSGHIDLKVNKIILSLGYKGKKGRDSWSIGLQGGLVNKRYNPNGMTLPGQYDREIGQFNPDLPTGESSLGNQIFYFDMGIGAAGKKRLPNWMLSGGLAFFHVNLPNESFVGVINRLPIRTVFHFDARHDISEKVFLKPQLNYMYHAKAQEILPALIAGIKLAQPNPNNLKALWMGVGVRTGVNRNGDAVFVKVGADFNQLSVGINYDVNYSGLSTATNNRGALEIAIVYTAMSTLLKNISIPCDRY